MTATIDVPFPGKLATSLHLNRQQFLDEIRRMAVVKLYELGKISSAAGADLLDISRLDFLEMLGQYRVSFFGQASLTELESDLSHA